MKKNTGFTLIETIVSVAIIAIMVTIITVSFSGTESAPKSLKLGIQDVSSIIRLAEDYASANYKCCGEDIITGYGVYFEIGDLNDPNNVFWLYANKDEDFSYDENSDEKLETFTLANDVKFYNTGGPFSISFPLQPGIAYLNNSPNSTDMRITFRYKEADKFQIMDVNGLTGRITVDDYIYEYPQ